MKKTLIGLFMFSIFFVACTNSSNKNNENDKEVKNSISQKKLKNKQITANWEISYFTDKFGEKTNTAFILYKKPIIGLFSNSVTTNSKLNVLFTINSPTDIGISLFEYGGSTPVRESSFEYDDFNVYARDKNGKDITYKDHYEDGTKVNVTMRAHLKGIRLVFDNKSAAALNKALLKGGSIKFYLEKASNGPLPTYSFILKNTDNYNNALKKLSKINGVQK